MYAVKGKTTLGHWAKALKQKESELSTEKVQLTKTTIISPFTECKQIR